MYSSQWNNAFRTIVDAILIPTFLKEMTLLTTFSFPLHYSKPLDFCLPFLTQKWSCLVWW
jgi:hypothetical protein